MAGGVSAWRIVKCRGSMAAGVMRRLACLSAGAGGLGILKVMALNFGGIVVFM